MGNQHQNQHYVSRVLLKRFTDAGFLQRFSLKSKTWKKVSSKQVFSGLGYTQLMAYGETDNSLEESFKKIEDVFPLTLKELDSAAKRDSTELPVKIYENLFWYCAYLWRISPFAKAAAPLEFVYQLEMDLKNGKIDLLKAIGIQESDIQTILNLHSNGAKFILQADNYLQLIYRIQFNLKCKGDFIKFRFFTKWTLYNSPIELPIPDIAFFQFFDQASNTQLYILPLGPKLMLVGKSKGGVEIKQSTETVIKADTLTADEAEYFLDAICLSAITAIACKSRRFDVLALRKRALEKKIHFVKIKDLDAVLSAGMKPFNGPLIILPVKNEKYVEFLKSFIEN